MQLWCAKCDQVQQVKSDGASHTGFMGGGLDLVHTYSRRRRCTTCGFLFTTVEVNIGKLRELLEFRKDVIGEYVLTKKEDING